MFSNDLVIKILNYIDNNIYRKISIDELSDVFLYNKDYIMRLFKKEIGYTIIDYINRKRVFNSLISYNSKNLSILSISLKYGFYSQEYYSEMFHNIMGVSPTTFSKFINYRNKVSIEDINNIQSNISKLDYEQRKINSYRSNIPPKSTIKVLSIFK